MHHVPYGTIVINAHRISGSDLGAVPSGSTKTQKFGLRGRNRIDGRLKMLAFARCGVAVIDPRSLVANNNNAPVALAA